MTRKCFISLVITLYHILSPPTFWCLWHRIILKSLVQPEHLFISLFFRNLGTFFQKALCTSQMVVLVIRIESVSRQGLKFVFKLESFVIEREYLVNLFYLFKIYAFICI